MFEKKKKFLDLMEASLARINNGGFAVGDYIKINKSAFNKKVIKNWLEQISDEYRKLVDEFSSGDKKLRIANITVEHPAPGGTATGTELPGQIRLAQIYEEIAANLWGNVVTVPLAILTKVDLEGNNITPGDPDYKDNKEIQKPVKVIVKVNSKNTNLPSANTTIPSAKVSDGRDQAKKPNK